MAFDEAHYKKIFEQRYGKGSFDVGLQQARQIGQLKVQAQLAKKDYTARLKAQQAAEKKAQKAADEQKTVYGGMTAKEAQAMQKRAQAEGRGGYQPSYSNARKEARKNSKEEGQSPYTKNPSTYDVSKLTPYAKQKLGYDTSWDQPKQKSSGGLLDKLSKLGEIVDRPGDAVRTGIKEAAQGHSFFKGLEDGFTGKKNTSGAEMNKALGFKGKFSDNVARFLARGLVSEQPGKGLSTPAVGKKLSTRIGKGEAGVISEIATDPLNLLGTGIVAKSIKGVGKLAKGVKATDEVLGLPSPQLRLNAPQLQLSAPKEVKPSLDTLMKVGKRPTGLDNPIPKMPTVMRNAKVQNDLQKVGLGFGYNTKLEPKARGILPKLNVSSGDSALLAQKGDNLLNDVSKLNGVPMNHFEKRLFQVQKEMKSISDKRPDYFKPLSIDELYQRVKKPGDPKSFDELIKMNELESNANKSNPVQGPREATIKDALNTDPRIKDIAKQLHFKAPVQKVSRPATLDEIVQRIGELAPPKQPIAEPTPLNFRVRKGFNPNTPTNILNRSNTPIKGLEAISKGKVKAEKISANPKVNDITAPQDSHGYGLIDTQAIHPNTAKTLQEMKDILPNQTLTRSINELTSRLPKEMADKIDTELATAKINNVNNIEQRTTDLYNKVVKGLGIKMGSKESALVQDFGEKTLAKNYLKKRGIDPSKVSEQELNNINLIQLKKIRPNDWQKIVEADKYIGNDYKKMIGEVNTTVKQIYQNNPDKIVPERKDYYHHFTDLTGFEGFKNLIKNSSSIDPHLAGISPHTKPNSKWAAFKQKRGNGGYTSDAIGGYLKYLQAASHSTHIDPVIKTLRQSAEQIATATEGTKNLNNLKTALEVHADNLAGKTNPVDRLFQDHIIGRHAMKVVNFVNGHIKKNLILGNLGSALGQVGNIPLTIGKAKQFAPQGMMDTLSYTANHLLGGEKNLSAPISKSQFLKERFSSKYFTRFDNGLLKKPEKMAVWLLETADKSGTYFAWNSMYRKGLAKGVADPIKFADNETRHIIAGRGIGEVPIAQRAKVTQLVAPFSLEIGNQWKVLGKQMSEKDFAGVITFLAASYGLNEVMDRVKGSEVSYNPVGAMLEGYNKTNGTGLDKLKGTGASLLGETVGNIPGGNYIPQLLGLKSQATKQALFGNRSPDRFGTGIGVASTIFKPGVDAISGKWGQAAKDTLPLALPFGGNQIKKTVGGIEALMKGGSYDSKGNLQYPVNANSKSDLLHSLAFGPTTTANGQDYYSNNRKALSVKQTTQFQNASDKQGYYKNLMYQRQVNSIEKKIKDMQKDRSLTPQERQQNMLILMKELRKIQK